MVTKERTEKSITHDDLMKAVDILRNARRETDETRDAAGILYDMSKSGGKEFPEASVLISRLEEKDFHGAFKGGITVAKLNVANNEEAHPEALDYLTRQIVFRGMYKNDIDGVRRSMLDHIASNPSTPKETLELIAHDKYDRIVREEAQKQIGRRRISWQLS